VTGFSGGDGSPYRYATIMYSSAGVRLWVNRFNLPSTTMPMPKLLLQFDPVEAVLPRGNRSVRENP
jgi:hypothetical protein